MLCSMSCNSFFFSSRRRHTRLQGDWSSDVCSSDLECVIRQPEEVVRLDHLECLVRQGGAVHRNLLPHAPGGMAKRFFHRGLPRSEERRVGKEGRSRTAPGQEWREGVERAEVRRKEK